jgi:predicted kinase
MHKPTLHFFCGKAASGKSTLAKKLAKENNAVLISEDIWLSRLYPNEINSLQDYIDYSRRLRLVVAPIVQEILERGLQLF